MNFFFPQGSKIFFFCHHEKDLGKYELWYYFICTTSEIFPSLDIAGGLKTIICSNVWLNFSFHNSRKDCLLWLGLDGILEFLPQECQARMCLDSLDPTF